MLWNALQAAGCHAEGWHNGISDDYKFYDMPDLLTIRRSFYHNNEIPDANAIINQLTRGGYKIDTLFIMRDCYATWQSFLRRNPPSPADDAPIWNFRPQRNTLVFLGKLLDDGDFFSAAAFARFTPITYEGFCLQPGFRKWLFEERLGLTNPVDFEIRFANPQYYEDNNA